MGFRTGVRFSSGPLENGIVCCESDIQCRYFMVGCRSATNGKRFAMFNNDGLNLCLMNGYYDELYPEKKETKGEIYPEYDDMVGIANAANSRKVFINLGVDDLDKEYQRIVELGIGKNLTSIRYLNVFSPYWYFTFMDPDGNPIEITGEHKE